MDQFKVDDEKIAYISQQFSVSEKRVRDIYAFFNHVITNEKYQYLAHIIRTMEAYIREKTGNPMFQINCKPLGLSAKEFHIGCAQYFPGKFFTVFFPPQMNEKQLRVCLAHELGHLFIIEMLNNGKGSDEESPLSQDFQTEPVSSIFGVFTILDKNHFYQEYEKPFNHKLWEDIVKDFVFLQDKAGGQ
jgi:hypothetical protein